MEHLCKGVTQQGRHKSSREKTLQNDGPVDQGLVRANDDFTEIGKRAPINKESYESEKNQKDLANSK